MRTEKEIKANIKECFNKAKNSKDVQMKVLMLSKIKTLEWVLNE